MQRFQEGGPDAQDLLEHQLFEHAALLGSVVDAGREHLARYKLPKAFVFVDHVVRSPAGKADYRWAREQASAAT